MAGGRAQFLKFGPLVTVDGEADTLDHGGIRGARHGVRVVLAALTVWAATLGWAGVTRAATGASPIGAHSMIQLDDPPSFMATLFSEASAMGASAIRLDVPPAIVFGGPSSDPGASERCGTDDLAWCSS